MGLNNDGKDIGLDAIAATILYLSLHTGDPGSTGTNEMTGGSPAYERQGISWNAASGGEVTTDVDATWDVPASTFSRVGFWSAHTSGTFYGYADITEETFPAQGLYTLLSSTIRLTG